ncbi:hypothetical protein DRO55_02340 [Candidatus Bathyarchaeota archaeon]|nr:MAG: hypothetical protein DRO55_02340 [Candidatus Bathyarchaeota archaeon]
MSGLVFSILLNAVALASLNRLLRDELNFDRIADGLGWRGRVEEDNRVVDVFIKYGENRVQLILPDASIPEETCKKTVKKIASSIYAAIYGVEPPSDAISVLGPAQSFCHYCLRPVNEMLFRCKRCGGLYCSEHRLPEMHNCPGLGASRNSVRTRRCEDSPKTGEKRGRMVVKEILCG